MNEHTRTNLNLTVNYFKFDYALNMYQDIYVLQGESGHRQGSNRTQAQEIQEVEEGTIGQRREGKRPHEKYVWLC